MDELHSNFNAKLAEYYSLLKISKYRTELMINQISESCVNAIITPNVIEMVYNKEGYYTLKPSVTGGYEDTNDASEDTSESADNGPKVMVF